MTPPHERIIRKFNPGTFQSDEEVIEQFVVREHELQIVMDTLRRNINAQSCQHLLIVAPRGRGKTMLLARSAAEIRIKEDLADRLVPIRFMEESLEIFTIGDFWIEALFQLAREIRADHTSIADELSKTHADLTSQWQSRDMAERARATVLDTADRLDKHLVVMVENLQSLLNDVDEDFGWSLRQALQTEPTITLLATATSRFRGLDDADQPFYELFRVVYLEPLDTTACGLLMHALTGEERHDIEPLRILTGGDPRLIVLIADFSLHRSFGELMQELVRLIDDHTEYFRSHLDSLPKTERRVYVALIDLWQPSTAGEIGARARMDIRKVSTSLGRLVNRGAISTSGRGNKRRYAATQRLYSIYYKLRREHNESAIVRSLVRFIVVFYRGNEAKKILDKALTDQAASPSFALELKRAMEAEKSMSETETADTPPAEGMARIQAGELDDELRRRFGESDDPELRLQVAKALVNKGATLSLDRNEAAIETYDELLRRFGESNDPELRLQVAKALVNKGVTLGSLDRNEAAVETFDELLRRFGESDDPELRPPVARALFNKGVTLGSLDRSEAEIETYDKLLRRFGESDDPELRPQVANALLNKGATLGSLDRNEAAIETYDELLRRFGESDDPELRLQVAKALVNKGVTRGSLDRNETAVETCDELLRRFGESDDPELRLQVAKALFNKGVTLGSLDRNEAAIETYDELLRRFGESDDPELRLQVANALLNKGAPLGSLDRSEAAIETCDELLRRFGESDDPELHLPVARALFNKGVTLSSLDRNEAAIETCDELLRRFGESDDPELRLPVAKALVNKGVTLGSLDRIEAEVETYDELLRRFGESDDPELRLPVANALFNKGVRLGSLDRSEAEIETYDELLRRFGESDDPELHLPVAKALVNRGATLGSLDRSEAAVETYDELLRRFGESDDPELHVLVAKALLGKGMTHARRDELNEVVNVCAEMIQRFGGGGEEISNMANEMFNLMVKTISTLGAEQAVADLLSKNTDTAAALWPLHVALRQYLGEDVRAPDEVMEVARDVLDRIRSHKE